MSHTTVEARLTMFDDKCVPEPLSIVLDMFVYPFLSPKSQGTERVQGPDVVDENIGLRHPRFIVHMTSRQAGCPR